MPIVSIDLAYRTYPDNGIVVIHARDYHLTCTFIRPGEVGLRGTPQPDRLADFLANLCSELGSSLLLIDGPQAWKDPANGIQHSRLAERALNTPAKTGLPGQVKPANYKPFVEFAISLFDSLSGLGWPRLLDADPVNHPQAIESFPLSAWRSLGIRPLPAKARATPGDLETRLAALRHLYPLVLSQTPNHDELQALASGLAGLGLLASRFGQTATAGVTPFLLDGHWREGLILNPVPARLAPDAS